MAMIVKAEANFLSLKSLNANLSEIQSTSLLKPDTQVCINIKVQKYFIERNLEDENHFTMKTKTE